MALDAAKVKRLFMQKALKVAKSAAAEVVQEQKALAPVDTGYLQANIHAEVTSDGDTISAEFHSDASYSVHQEYGTSKMEAHPFFRGPLMKFNRKLQERMK